MRSLLADGCAIAGCATGSAAAAAEEMGTEYGPSAELKIRSSSTLTVGTRVLTVGTIAGCAIAGCGLRASALRAPASPDYPRRRVGFGAGAAVQLYMYTCCEKSNPSH